MDSEKLKADWVSDPQLSYLAFDTVRELAEHLRKCHADMMEGKLGCLGYLYRQQTLRVKQLAKELDHVRCKQPPS